jgi:hypothetical protein
LHSSRFLLLIGHNSSPIAVFSMVPRAYLNLERDSFSANSFAQIRLAPPRAAIK